MSSAVWNYFGLGGRGSTVENKSKSPVRALPSSWYTSQQMYELERRAIFSKKWMLITHKVRLTQSGDWLKFDITGYEFVLCRDQNGVINGFHNAPKYQELEGFDKSRDGLFPIHVRIDAKGFIWVNLDSNEAPEVAWEDDFSGIDRQERYDNFNFDDYVLDSTYQMEGAHNWKLLADNFNECYHCPTTHPDVPDLADIETHDVNTDFGWIKHQSTLTEKQKEKGLGIASTYYFPNVSLSILPHYIMLQRFLPNGPTSSSMQYQIFRNKHSSEEDFQLINQMYRRIVGEDKVLCELAQRNLNAGIFVNGELHPRLEKGPLYFQKVARETIQAHFEREKAANQEIWPARQNLPSTAMV